MHRPNHLIVPFEDALRHLPLLLSSAIITCTTNLNDALRALNGRLDVEFGRAEQRAAIVPQVVVRVFLRSGQRTLPSDVSGVPLVVFFAQGRILIFHH